MCRRSELLFFYQDGASHIFPDKFQPYRELIPVEERGDMIAAYYKRLTSSDRDVRRAAAREWTLWEMGTSKLMPDSSYIDKVIYYKTITRQDIVYEKYIYIRSIDGILFKISLLTFFTGR